MNQPIKFIYWWWWLSISPSKWYRRSFKEMAEDKYYSAPETKEARRILKMGLDNVE